jgi:hypothetical protein
MPRAHVPHTDVQMPWAQDAQERRRAGGLHAGDSQAAMSNRTACQRASGRTWSHRAKLDARLRVLDGNRDQRQHIQSQ